ncbi:nucleotidyl transferase AbiEii/AbiGii toxin family protein [Candidatus Microgenomates bacterium]|nr:nucleotidyl transferase AbiEii/AbiGii toxin family protein [Candidatus Microgenomates bacterium]
MFTNTLSSATQKLLSKLRPMNLPPGSYLAGGTAIALQLGHRQSNDLDFFAPTKFSEISWEEKLTEELGLVVTQQDWQTLAGTIGDVKFSLFYFPHDLIEKPIPFQSLNLASLPDLAAIKLNTIISRGAKRDLIDIYFLAQKYSLPKLFTFYDKKFHNFAEREIMIKKALVYFDEANRDEDPKMISKVSWDTIKKGLVKLVAEDQL